MSEQVQSPTALSGLSASTSALACTPRHVATKRKLSPPGGGFGGEGGPGGGGAGGAGDRNVPRVQLPCPSEHDGKRVHVDPLDVTPKFHVAHRVSFAHAAQQSADELPAKLPMDAPRAQHAPSVTFAELQLVALTLPARTGESTPIEALSSDLNCSHCAGASSRTASTRVGTRSVIGALDRRSADVRALEYHGRPRPSTVPWTAACVARARCRWPNLGGNFFSPDFNLSRSTLQAGLKDVAHAVRAPPRARPGTHHWAKPHTAAPHTHAHLWRCGTHFY